MVLMMMVVMGIMTAMMMVGIIMVVMVVMMMVVRIMRIMMRIMMVMMMMVVVIVMIMVGILMVMIMMMMVGMRMGFIYGGDGDDGGDGGGDDDDGGNGGGGDDDDNGDHDNDGVMVVVVIMMMGNMMMMMMVVRMVVMMLLMIGIMMVGMVGMVVVVVMMMMRMMMMVGMVVVVVMMMVGIMMMMVGMVVMMMMVIMRMVGIMMVMILLFQPPLKDNQLAGSSHSEQRDDSLHRTILICPLTHLVSISVPEFTEQPGLLKGYSIHTRLAKGPRGFGFNIVGGSRPKEFLQVYSVTPGGPPALNTADILVYINESSVLGSSHKEVVEMLKAVPMGQSVDVVLRRGYPMLYNPDGCPKQSPETLKTPSEPPYPPNANRHLPPGLRQTPPSYAPQPMTNGLTGLRTPPSGPLPPPERTGPNNPKDSDGGLSNEGARRSSLICYSSSTLPTFSSSSLLLHQSSKSSESDLSTSTLPTSSSTLPISYSSHAHSKPNPSQPETGLYQSDVAHMPTSSSPPGAPVPQNFPLAPPPLADPLTCGFNGCPANHPLLPTPPAPRGNPLDLALPPLEAAPPGELVPVTLAHGESGGLGFSVTQGAGWGGQLAVVRRVWDRRRCPSLQTGDTIVKVNGADVQNLGVCQVQRLLQENTKKGEVVLLVFRGAGSVLSPVVTPNLYKLLPSPHSPAAPTSSKTPTSPDLTLPNTGDLMGGVSPLGPSGLVLECSREVPAMGTPQEAPDAPASTLIQSTSFLDSVPVTLTLEPRDLLGVEEGAGRPPPTREGAPRGALGAIAKEGRAGATRMVEVDLRRRAGEGFGFVIASQEASDAPSLMSHRFVTVRRGSPAARSGQIQPGDQLDAVEGRGVGGLQHRDLAQILRRAGNTLRLSITPRHHSSSLLGGGDLDIAGQLVKESRGRSKEESRFYNVDLERGPTGFGFSLRGGSEYNMGLYVLGLMEGGPAQRSNKIQVSDQLVEINGDSTSGMTHSQAVEQIRRGGQRIHLVLKKGNGYVPDYGPEEGGLPNSSSSHAEENDSMTVTTTTASLCKPQGEEGKRRTKRGVVATQRTRKKREEGRGPPDLDLDMVEEEAWGVEEERRRRGRRKIHTVRLREN
ncbi:uncharacterized protein magixa isoform X6 [Pungitius pungitius]|uniref:uncharacterized protein magixa isoform X6 n=1 Tax=Pungitius pungitius TaxID=134920 RepID=UPI002E0DC154